MANIYLQIDSDNVVWDAIEYEREGYTPVDVELPLPIGCIGGWYRWINGAFEVDQDRYDRLNQIQERDALITQLQGDIRAIGASLGLIKVPAEAKAILDKYGDVAL